MEGFWAGRRVFITGHTGFKGGWLALWLKERGAKVAGFALAPPMEPTLFTVARVAEVVEQQFGDIRDPVALKEAVADFQPEIVFHMAAQPLVRLSYRMPVETYATNVMGTVHLLEAVRATASVRVAVVVTSDKCYDNRKQVGRAFVEDDPMGGRDPYSSSKGCTELVAQSYAASFFGDELARIASVRAGNVIGGGDWSLDRLIPDIIRSLQEGQAVSIRNPDAVRPWQHVLEPLSGYLLLAERMWNDGTAAGQGWNFGPRPESEWSVADIVKRLAVLWKRPEAYVFASQPDQPHEDRVLRLDSSKSEKCLGWRPRLSLNEALEQTVDWYRAWSTGTDMQSVTRAQIHAYEKRIALGGSA